MPKPKGSPKTGGRAKGTPNKATADVKRLAGQYSEAALQTLAHIAQHGESEQARVSAANSLLDRAHGRPSQAIANDPDQPFKLEITWKTGRSE